MAQTKNSKSTQSVKQAGSQGVGTGSKGKIIEFVDGHWVTQVGVNINQLMVAQQLMDDELPSLPNHGSSEVQAIFKKDALHIQQELTNLLARIKRAEKNNTTDCANATKWFDEANDLNGQAADNPQYQRDVEKGNNLTDSLESALKKVIEEGISECKNSKPGKPPAGRNCLQKLLTKSQKYVISSNKVYFL